MRKLPLLVEESPVNAPPLHPDSVLLITLDFVGRQFRQYYPSDDRVGPCIERWHPVASLWLPCGHVQGFFASVRAARPLQPKAGQVVSIGHAGWPGKEREEFQPRPSIIEGFHRQGHRTVGSGAVGWFDPATETGRCLTLNLSVSSIQVVHLAEQLPD